MKNKFCIIVFSHADTKEKEDILNQCLLSIKKIGIKIILSSHISVSERNQKLSDYFIKDDNNLILKESDIFSSPCEICENVFTITDYIGDLKVETSVFKNTYQSGVFNLYISSFNFANQLGFKNAILWEYDYILGENSLDFILDSMKSFDIDNLENISFLSFIGGMNGNKFNQMISCCHAIPSFFNIDKILSFLPKTHLYNSEQYNNATNLKIIEQWMYENVIENIKKKKIIDYTNFANLLPDTTIGQVHSQRDNYLLFRLKSGLYFNEYEYKIIFINSSESNLNSKFSIKDITGDILYEDNVNLVPNSWKYNSIGKSVVNKFYSEGCYIEEIVEDLDNGEIDIFNYTINKNNIDFISKLKRFSRI